MKNEIINDFSSAMESKDVVLKACNITRRFGNETVIDSVSLTLCKSEIHCILGAKGAGKTTLMKILSGVITSNDGFIEIDKKIVNNFNLEKAIDIGIKSIYADHCLMQEMSVSDNIFISNYASNKIGLLSYRKLKKETFDIFTQMGIDIDPNRLVVNLTNFEKLLVQIARVYVSHSKIILMDDIFLYLDTNQKEKMFRLLKSFSNKGMGIIYFTSSLDDAFEIADTISVMRDGKLISTRERKEFIVEIMIQELLDCDSTSIESCLNLIRGEENPTSFLKLVEANETNDNIMKYLNAAISYINDNFSEDLTPQLIADKVHLSSGYLMMLFRNFLATSIMEYTYRLRIIKSKELLKNKDLKIYEVAASVGITNSQYFSVLFKKETSMSPKEYRNAN